MRRVIVPALLAVAMIAFSSADANALGLFDWSNKGDNCCDVEPVCAAEPNCGCEAACEPACSIEADPCCDPCGRKPKWCLLNLFSKNNNCCDQCGGDACGCEPACAAPYEPTCGCEAPCETPVCGCEVVDPCCDSGFGKPKWCLFDLFSKKNQCCDTCGGGPNCGCGGCEPTCGCEAACGY
jgi:hypothetical protein